MQQNSSNRTSTILYTKAKSKKKFVIAKSVNPLEQFIAPFCTNKAGEKSPKTDLQLLLNASCDCV